ncbi:PKD domain-containing protein [Pedobacter sp. WC2501]|uniref:PKD domain-containing protein n=1 Tax=Pedobacter sp. WC2501 TaxID=3461400 RepID=UPI004045BA1A
MNKRLLLVAFFCFFLSKEGFSASLIAVSAKHYKYVKPAITANGPINFCQGGSVKLQTAETGAIYQWIKNGVDINNETAVSYIATSTGSYVLRVIKDGVPEESNAIVVTVDQSPLAGFTTNATGTNCSNEEISFTNSSTGTITSYEWDFGDPNSGAANKSNEVNPKHIFIGTNGSGIQTFPVKLTVKNGTCESVKTLDITTKKIPRLDIVDVDSNFPFSNCHKSPSLINPNYTLTLKNNSPNATFFSSYIINWGDNTGDIVYNNSNFPISHTYTTLGAFQLIVKGISIEGCQVVFNQVVANQSNPAGGLATNGNTAGLCGPVEVPFVINNWKDNSPGTMYKLDFGDGEFKTFTHPLNNTGDPFTYNHLYTKSSCPSKFYTAILTVTNACSETEFRANNIVIWTKPEANFLINPASSCIGKSVLFTNKSISGHYGNTCSSGTTYAWDFGDLTSSSNSSTLENPTHIYNTPGNYNVTLTATNGCGSTTKELTICINPLPVAAFTVDQNEGCGPLTIQTNNTSNTPTCGANTYTWTVTYANYAGCAGTSGYSLLNGTLTSQNPKFQFNNAGIYTISLITRNSDNGCVSSKVDQVIKVKAKPTVSIPILSAICAGGFISPVAAVNTCSSNSVPTYLWKFPGSNTPTSTLLNPTNIIYPVEGIYDVTLEVTNECGTTISAVQKITVNAVPVMVPITDLTVCKGAATGTITFSTNPINSAVKYSWVSSNPAIGLGNGTTNAIPSFIANNNINAVIFSTITVTPKLGNCDGTPIQFKISVNPSAPTANAGPDQDLCDVTTTTLSGTDPTSTFAGQWTQVTGPSAGIVFADASKYNTMVSGLAAGNVYEFKWTINGLGSCPVTSDIVKITVSPKTIGGNTSGAQSFCGGPASGSISLTGNVGSVIQWESSIDGANWTAINFTATTYNYSGITKTTQFRAVVKSGGCSQEYSDVTTITVNPTPAKPTGISTINYCLNDPAAALSAVGSNLKWYTTPPASTGFSLTAPTPATTLAATIKYYVTQTVNGCESLPLEITVKVNPPITNNVIASDQNICMGSTPSVLNQSGSALSGGSGTFAYQWQQSADGNSWTDIINENAVSYQPGALNTNTYYRRVVKSLSCSSQSNPVKISVQGTLSNFQVSANQTICSGLQPDKLIGDVPLGGSGTYTYTWEKSTASVSSGFTIITGENAADYQPQTLTQTTYYRRITSSGSCSATSTVVTISVNPIPVIQSITDIITCNSSLLPATVFQSNISGVNVGYTWANDNVNIGLTASGTGNLPSFTTQNTSKIPLLANITVIPSYTSGGKVCTGAATNFKITVLPGITTASLADITVCAGAQVPVNVLSSDAAAFAGSTVTYNWTVTGGTIGLTNGTGLQISAFNAVNNTALPITVSISVLPTYEYQGKKCSGIAAVYKITVNPAPVINFSIPDQTICSSATSVAVTLSSTTPGTSFSWNAQPVAGVTGLILSGTDKIPAQNLINITNLPLTVIYEAVASTSGAAQCPGSSFLYKITVNPATTVTPSENSKTICSGTKTGISLSSAVAGTVFNWTVSNNQNISGSANGTGNIIDQSLINTSATLQTVNYTITPKFTGNNVGCDGAPIQVSVSVNPSPKVQFSGADIAICSGAYSPEVLLSSTTSGAKITWVATVPVGISGATVLNGASIIPSESLTNNTNTPLTIVYTATASTNDATACAGADFLYKVTVNPVAKITNASLLQSVCSGSITSAFIPTSNVTGTTYKWTISSASASLTGFVTSGTGNIPVQTIVNSSIAAEMLKYTITPEANGCVGLPSDYEITVNPKPVFSGASNPAAICSNTIFSYVPGSSTVGVTFSWKRAAVPGISNPAASGNGIDQAGSISETLINTTINPIDVTYIYELSIGGCTSANNYPVMVRVNPAPTALFGPFSQNGCAPFAINVKNLNSKTFANTYTVDYGDGSAIDVYTDERDISHVYENETVQPKTFKLKIKTKNDCGEVASIEYVIVVQPQSVFSKLVLQGNQRFGCTPFAVDFTTLNQSTGANVYTWDFGDGSPIQETHRLNEPLTHTYLSAGDYTITLTATNGCSTVKSQQTVTVYPNVSASFKVNKPQYCLSEAVVFTNTSDQQFTAFWDFGDGKTSTDINPSHTYTTAGTKTVVLTATKTYPDGSSCTTSATQTVDITPGPVSSFNSNAGNLNCAPFKLMVTTTPANAANVEWDFGDPASADNIATGYSASHYYTVPGTYLVTAKAYSLQGCTAVTTQTVKITETPKPVFTFPANLICGPNATIQFKNETTYGGTDAVTYKWYINDVFTSSNKDFVHTFNTPASVLLPYVYRIKLEAINILGCVNSVEHTVQFNPLPQANFTLTINKACVPFTPQITNNSLYADKFEWYVDGVLVSTDKIPSNIIFNEPDKTYNIKLVADNQYGCGSSNVTKQAITYPSPKASFTIKQDVSCNGILDVEITNTSIGATAYTWDYGDGSTTYIGNSPKHVYGKAGIYQLKLSASNGFCTDVFTQTIKIADAPKAGFLADVKSGCNQLTVTFQNISNNASRYLWDFGDGSFSTQKNPVHTYNFVKSPFTVKLTATGDFDCTDEMVMLNYISVFAPPVAEIVISPSRTVKVPDYGFSFKVKTDENITVYKWDFGDGKTADKASVDHNYADVGTYKIKLTLTNASGCTNVIEDQVSVVGVPGYFYLPNAFEPANAKPDLKVFKITATGMSAYTLRVFNKWGQMIWQSSKLDEEGVPTEFWDGTMNGQPAPQGAYYWSADAKFINGTDWKGMKYEGKSPSKTGVVHLIR